MERRGGEEEGDELADSLNDLFTSIAAMIGGDIQESNCSLGLLEKMNQRVAEEYQGFADLASDLRIFMQRLKSKTSDLDAFVQHIHTIEKQVTDFEAVISMLDKYVSILESKVSSLYPNLLPP